MESFSFRSFFLSHMIQCRPYKYLARNEDISLTEETWRKILGYYYLRLRSVQSIKSLRARNSPS